MVAGGGREPPHPVCVEQRSYAVVAGADDPMPSASELGNGRFPVQLLEAIDRCLRLRETERIQDAHDLLGVLRAASDYNLPSYRGFRLVRARRVADWQEGSVIERARQSPAPFSCPAINS